MRDMCISTVTTCKQKSVLGEVRRLSKHEIYGAFSERIHSYEYLYNLHFLAIIQCFKNAELCLQNVCKPLIARVHPGFFSIHAGKNSRQDFCFKLMNLCLLYEMRNRVWRDCKQLTPNKSMFSSENFQSFALQKCFLHDCVQPGNVAIAPPEGILLINY